jgi:hypothetical protein
MSWEWHEHRYGVVFEVLFDSDQQWEAFRALPRSVGPGRRARSGERPDRLPWPRRRIRAEEAAQAQARPERERHGLAEPTEERLLRPRRDHAARSPGSRSAGRLSVV